MARAHTPLQPLRFEPQESVPDAVAVDVPSPSLGSGLSRVSLEIVHLSWQGLTVTAHGGKKVLLESVDGIISGGFHAVMGPSGSGKSTLLNALACRMDPAMSVSSGDIKLNGRSYTGHDIKQHAGYVMQDDLLNGSLTVAETLRYTADLRLPQSLPVAERARRIEEVVQQMGLGKVLDVLVGTPLRKGISGGERKRLCVAMELITRPLLLFLDEPTSGLDSVTALSLCRTLRELAASGRCTVVCTIHQPQAKIFRLFTALILLRAGHIVYQGPAAGAQAYFADKLGMVLPPNENPADFFLDAITPDPHDSMNDLMAMEKRILEASRASKPEIDAGLQFKQLKLREKTTWWHQFQVLFRRSITETLRNRSMLLVQLVQTVLIAVLIGTAFKNIGTSETSTLRRQPVLFFCVVNQGIFSALIVINVFPRERLLVLRERAAGTYYASAYFLSKNIAEVVITSIFPIIFTCVVYFLVGLHSMPGRFFTFMAFMILCSTAATSLALMTSALARTTDMSVAILPFVLEISRLFGGFFLSPAISPHYFWFLDALSYVKYTYVGISLNELKDLRLYCTPANLAENAGKCAITRGEQRITELGLDEFTIGECAGILIFYILFCRTVAYLGVRFIKN